VKHQNVRLTHGSELIGRKLKNCFGVEEIAAISRDSWRYYDWCVEQGFDMDAWVEMVDELRPHQLTFSEVLEGAFWKDECKRFHRGEHVPPWEEPEGCFEYIETLEGKGKF